MENLCIAEDISSESNDIFKLEYKGQLIKDNAKFKAFKKEKIKKYGSNAKLYHCKNENLYFYVPTKKNNFFSFDAVECPSCKENICYFCSKDSTVDLNCCPIGSMYDLLFHKGLTFTDDKENVYEGHDVTYYQLIPKFFIPFYSFIYLVGIISFKLFHGLRKNDESKEGYYYFKENCQGLTSILFNALLGLALYITFFIHTIYFKLLILISSIFFKNKPFRYYLGIIGFGVDQFQ